MLDLQAEQRQPASTPRPGRESSVKINTQRLDELVDLVGELVIAQQMVNFVYLIGDRERGECVAVDPAWSVQGLLDVAAADDMKLTGVLATHYHPDHVGGDLLGMAVVEGVKELLERHPRPTREQVREALSGNLCRCTGYLQIFEAVENALARGSE